MALEEQALAEHAAAGTRPSGPLGKSRLTWSGLSDHALAEQFNKPGWYDLFYGPMSDQSHVKAAAIGVELSSILQGDVTIGGRFDSPFLALLAACETATHASEVIDKYFSLGSSGTRSALDDEMKGAINNLLPIGYRRTRLDSSLFRMTTRLDQLPGITYRGGHRGDDRLARHLPDSLRDALGTVRRSCFSRGPSHSRRCRRTNVALARSSVARPGRVLAPLPLIDRG